MYCFISYCGDFKSYTPSRGRHWRFSRRAEEEQERTYENVVLRPLLRTSSELVKGGKCVSVGNHEEWSWHSQVVMTVLQEQSKPSWYCLEMDVSV